MQSRIHALKQGACFFLFNTVFILLIGSRYFQSTSDISSGLSILYVLITTISHFVLLSFMIYALAFFPVIMIYPNKTLTWIWAGIVSAIGSLLLLIDTYSFDLYHFHVNKYVLDLIFGGAATQIFEFSIKQYILLFAILLGMLAISLLFSYLIFRFLNKKKLTKVWLFLGCVFVMMLGGNLLYAWAYAAGYTPITKSSRYYPLYFPLKADCLFLKLRIVDRTNLAQHVFIGVNKSSDFNYPKHHIVCQNTKNRNIIIILLDSWYFKAFDSTSMPNIYNFSKRCDIFNNHFSGSNGTRTGVFSLFYSIPGIYWNDIEAHKTSPVLIDELLKMKYTIRTYTSASLVSPPFDRTVFKNVPNLVVDTKGQKAYNRDKQLSENWISYINKRNKTKASNPLMAFLFYDALHAFSHPKSFKGPFQPEWEYPKYECLNNNSDPAPMLNLYKNASYYVDSLIGIVLNNMENSGLLKNSMIIITGDHAQEFNDNKKNCWGHNSNYSASQLHIPLIIYTPECQHKVYNHWTSHYDIVPTILQNVFNCKNPVTDYSYGKNLYNTSHRNWLLVSSNDDFAIIQPKRLITVRSDGTYDITDSHLNPINNARLEPQLINTVLESSKSFYNKSKIR